MKHIAYFLRDIHFNNKTGQLLFKRGDIKKFLFVQVGDLLFAKTGLPEERLGEILMKLGKISGDAFKRLDSLIDPLQNIGEMLVKKEMITPEDLQEALTHQLKEITLNMFPFFDADFVFQPREPFVDTVQATVNIPQLIEDGIRRMEYHPSIKLFMEQKIAVRRRNIYIDLVNEEENRILESIDGKTPAGLLSPSVEREAGAFWKGLYLLYCLDLIGFAGEDTFSTADQSKAALSRDESEHIAEVMAVKEKLQRLSCYDILNVPQTATETELKKSYFQLARKFHPDSFSGDISPPVKEVIEEVFDEITKAYKTLSNKEKRAVYDAKLAAPLKEVDRDSIRKADIKFRQAKTLSSQGRYEEALILIEEAVRIKKDKGDYYLLLAMIESKIPALTRKAEGDFLKATELEPWNPEGYVGLGLLYKNEGLPTRASNSFKKALEIDPEHHIARKELDILIGKRKKGLFQDFLSFDLFGRKKK